MAKASLNADYVRTEISRWQARSMVMSTRGIVAADQILNEPVKLAQTVRRAWFEFNRDAGTTVFV